MTPLVGVNANGDRQLRLGLRMLLSHAILLGVVPRRTARLRAAQTSLESLLGRVPGGPHAFFEPTRRRQGAPRAIRRTPSEVRLQTATSHPQVNKSGAIDLAYRLAEAAGIPLWCQDEAGPYQAIPHAGAGWAPVGEPSRLPHEYVRGGTAK